MPEREIKPGISLAGAIDLEGLKHQVKAEPGQAGGAPAAGGYVIDCDTEQFPGRGARRRRPTRLSSSCGCLPTIACSTWPANSATRSTAWDGKLQLARIDVSREPEIAQAFGVQGAPALFALIGGRPMPILQGMPQGDEMTQITTQVLPQLVQVAAQAGVTGTAPYITPQNADDEEDTQKEPAVPPEHAEAHRLAQEGDYAGAADAYEQVLEREPDDELAKTRACEGAAACPFPRMRMCARHARRPRKSGRPRRAAGRRRRRYDRRPDSGCLRPSARLSGSSSGCGGADSRTHARVLPHSRGHRRAV